MFDWFHKRASARRTEQNASNPKGHAPAQSARIRGRATRPSRPRSQPRSSRNDWQAEQDWITRYGDPLDD
jgi:hypothetical protein